MGLAGLYPRIVNRCVVALPGELDVGQVNSILSSSACAVSTVRCHKEHHTSGAGQSVHPPFAFLHRLSQGPSDESNVPVRIVKGV